jgi:two-component system nitrate/nitrite response regulator NarL
LPPVTIFVCESQPIVVEGLERVLAAHPQFQLCGVANSFPEAMESVRGLAPQVVLVDQAPGLKMALQFISDLKSVSPVSRCVLWAQELAETECFRVLQMGARGVIRKVMPVTALLDCLRSVAEGAVWVENAPDPAAASMHRRGIPRLTPREREIVHHVCRGLKNKEIADSLAITAGTVKVHLMHIFEKTGVKDRFELAIHGRKLAGE